MKLRIYNMSRGKPKSVLFHDFTTLLPYEVKREIQFHFGNEAIYLLCMSVKKGPQQKSRIVEFDTILRSIVI